MASFLIRTKNETRVSQKPRVYFTCHPKDFDRYFEEVCSDLFRTQDPAISYTPDMTDPIPAEDRETDLGRSNLFVVPVTARLLTEKNRAMDEDIPYARANGIPILPLMMETGLDSLYSAPNRFGELQYLKPFSHDLTEISYEEKLKRFLESVLIGDQLAERIRSVFKAYVFLSYRKKDRRFANELMRRIHQNPDCRDVAVWFDEFLTPGESFQENIAAMLEACRLFVLTVTPRLLETVTDENGTEHENYVLSTELPLAKKQEREKGTPILAVEMEKTESETLSSRGIPSLIPGGGEELQKRLSLLMEHIPSPQMDGAEHDFLVGLAYLDGIDVEVDRSRGLSLVTAAAEAGLAEAMKKLSRMYSDGIGVALDYRKAAHWAEKTAAHFCEKNGHEHPETVSAMYHHSHLLSLAGDYRKAAEIAHRVYEIRKRLYGEEDARTLSALNNLGISYRNLGDYPKALALDEKVYHIRCRLLGAEHPATLTSLSNLAHSYQKAGNSAAAAEMDEQCYRISCRVLGEEHPDTLTSLSNLAISLNALGQFSEAMEKTRLCWEIRCRVLGEEHPDTLSSLSNLAYSHNMLGQLNEAVEKNRLCWEIRCRVLGEEHPDTLTSLNNLAQSCFRVRDYQKALEFTRRCYELHARVLGEEHPSTLTCLNNLALSFYQAGDLKKALESFEICYESEKKVLGAEHPTTLNTLNNISSCYDALGRTEEAIEACRQCWEVQRRISGEEHPKAKDYERMLKEQYYRNKQYEKAIAISEERYLRLCRDRGEEHPDTIVALEDLGYGFTEAGDLKTAISLYEKAYEIRCRVSGADDFITGLTQMILENLRSTLGNS